MRNNVDDTLRSMLHCDIRSIHTVASLACLVAASPVGSPVPRRSCNRAVTEIDNGKEYKYVNIPFPRFSANNPQAINV
jgi:hypothetical protein